MSDSEFVLISSGKNTNLSKSLEYGIMQTNMWNMEEFDGNVKMILNGKALNFNIKINDARCKQDTIFGYPEVAVGKNLMNQDFKGDKEFKISFPARVIDIMNNAIKLSTEFSIINFEPCDLPFNLSYDFWIKDPSSFDMPGEEDYEIMIWLFRNTQKPIGSRTGIEKLRCIMDGKEENVEFSVWVGRGAKWKTITFIMENSNKIKSQSISIFMGDFFKISTKYVENTFLKKSVMGIEFGTEFGNPSKIRTNLEIKLSRLMISINSEDIDLLEYRC